MPPNPKNEALWYWTPPQQVELPAAAGDGVREDQTKLIRWLIWLYLALWLTEGALRRWFLPGLAGPLLLIRDPVVVAIYVAAYSKNLFPFNGFIYSGLALALLTFFNAMITGHGNPLVAAYGVRCDFLHVPLIFIMGRVLRREDLTALAKVVAWIALPYSLLLMLQFYSPQSAWVNRGVGGSLDGAGFSGALDRFRPPGTFSFITGVAQFYTFLTACWFALVLARKMPAWLMICSGVAILVAVPISVSRGLFLCVAFVACAGVAALLVGGRLSASTLLRAAAAAVVLPLLALQLPAFHDGMDAFTTRWTDATTNNGGVKGAIVDRLLDDYFSSFATADLSGLGTGYSTNVGQSLLVDEVGFGASEGEWGRLIYDNGLLLGSLVLLYRVALTGAICLAALRAWRRRSPEGIVFASAAVLELLSGQWGQSTTLGAAAIGAGLAMAAANNFKPESRKTGGVHKTALFHAAGEGTPPAGHTKSGSLFWEPT
jgi:hypothetical protein